MFADGIARGCGATLGARRWRVGAGAGILPAMRILTHMGGGVAVRWFRPNLQRGHGRFTT
jgi:hypothetical protein